MFNILVIINVFEMGFSNFLEFGNELLKMASENAKYVIRKRKGVLGFEFDLLVIMKCTIQQPLYKDQAILL